MEKWEEKKEIINVIGVLEAIQYNALSIEEAEAYIFLLSMQNILKHRIVINRLLS